MTPPTPLTLPTLTDALKPTLVTKQFSSENILAALVGGVVCHADSGGVLC